MGWRTGRPAGTDVPPLTPAIEGMPSSLDGLQQGSIDAH
jgi:hypothetical protein